MKNFAQLCPRDTVGTGGNTSDFLWYCSLHPTFLLQPSHPACKPQPPLITQPWLEFAHCFLQPPPHPLCFFFYRQWPRKHLGAVTSDRRWRMAFCCVSKYSAYVMQRSSTSHSCSSQLSWGSGLWCKCWYFPDGPPAGSLCLFVIHLKCRDSRGCFMRWLSEICLLCWDLTIWNAIYFGSPLICLTDATSVWTVSVPSWL